ncbi:bifunctional aminoglycoside phosphotransferase/ATP-binding protein [soil metagenome]
MNLPTTATRTAPEGAPVFDTAAEIRETHTGIVVLIGDRAYKMKKPVLTDFLDFRTPEAREHVCARELALNSRMAPDSYLGIAHLELPDRAAPEPMVVMRRYPDRYRLQSMVLRGEPTESHLDALADHLSGFHAHATRSPHNDGRATASALAALWRENLDELEHHAGTVLGREKLAEVRQLAIRYINGRTRLFADRVTAGRIVDGHGDLMAEDIFCTPDGPVPLDCLEFDDQLRHIDGIDDAAFLAMDLEFLGRADLAEHFLARYRAAAADTAPRSLVDFYIAYRAVVRAKVDCIKLSQGRLGADADARFHLDLALAHLRSTTVRLIIVGGGPGTGKTTLSTALATPLSAQVISTDDVRRELRDDGQLVGEAGAVDAGLYASENVTCVYTAVLNRAGRVLAGGDSVILDGTWRDPEQRRRARETATEANAVLVEIACTTDLSGAQKRISARTSTNSDATPHVAAAITAEPWAGAHCIDTGRPLAESVAEAQQICCLAI